MAEIIYDNLELTARAETWPIAGSFVISRGAKSEAIVIVASIREKQTSEPAPGGHGGSAAGHFIVGRGEAVAYPRFNETPGDALAQLFALDRVPDRNALQDIMPPGAARNALDCALWDYEAKHTGLSAAGLAGIDKPKPLLTAYTISLGSVHDMAAAARKALDKPLLKLKLDGTGDKERMKAVRHARPDARLIVDANEAWAATDLQNLLHAAADAGVELVEQPLRAKHDMALLDVDHTVPVCADESAHTATGLAELQGRYDAVNIKLDKTGGLTEALIMAASAKSLGLKIMAGCMVSTSLSMAPAMLLAQYADWVDLDGPLLLSRDREHGLSYDGAMVSPPDPKLWG